MQENLELKLQGNRSFCDFIMLGFATTAMLCKVGHVVVSMFFPALLKLKRKQTELLLCDAVTLYFGRSWRFAWSLAASIHGVCVSNGRILKKPALGE